MLAMVLIVPTQVARNAMLACLMVSAVVGFVILDLVCHAEWSSSPRQICVRPVKEHINCCRFEIAMETTLGLGVRHSMSSQRRRRSRIASASRWTLDSDD